MIKPGSLCLVIRSDNMPEIVGMECTVLQLNVNDKARNPDGSLEEVTGGVVIELSNRKKVMTRPQNLLPIDPDPDEDYHVEEDETPRETVTVH